MVRWGAVAVLVLGLSARAGAQTLPPPETVKAKGCTFTLSVVVEPGTLPPIYDVVLSRSDCAGGKLPDDSVVLGSSYGVPVLSLAGHGDRLAASFTQKATPSGSAHISLAIRGIDPETLEITRQTSLAAMSPDPFHPQQGNVYSGDLTIHGKTLIVQGTFDGIIPGMTGSGTNYRATYSDFFEPGPDGIPPEVVAF